MAKKSEPKPSKTDKTKVSSAKKAGIEEFFFKVNISERQKLIFAGIISVLLVAGLFFGVNWFSNEKFRNRLLGIEEPKTAIGTLQQKLIDDSLNTINQTVGKTKPDDLIYQDVKLSDLDLYPKTWIEANFSSEEIQNALISGPSADPDSDSLSNKQEYLYGSNPKSAYTLCGKPEGEEKCKKNDGQLINESVSPLTGFALTLPKTVRLKRIDKSIAERVQDSFNQAAKEGVDFPKLYQQSRSIDLSKEFAEVKIATKPNERDTILKYLDKRVEVLQEFAKEDEFSSFTEVYKLIDVKNLDLLSQKYSSIKDKMKSMEVPEMYADSHRANIYVLRKLVDLIEYRKKVLTEGSFEDPKTQENSRQKALEVLWAYRNLHDLQQKLEDFIKSQQN